MAFKIRDRIPSVHFKGLNEERRTEKNARDTVVSKRLIGLLVFLLAMSSILVGRLAYIQLKQQSLYEVKLEKYGTSTFTRDAYRGEIVDRNGIKLVENKSVSNAVYYAPKSITKEEIEKTADFLVDNITFDTSNITDRQKRDFFIYAFEKEAKSIVSKEKLDEFSAQEDGNKALDSYIVKNLTNEFMDKYMDERTLKKTRLVFLMKQCTSGSSVLIEDLSVEDASTIGVNGSILKGVKVTQDWSRENKNGNNFARVLGRVTTKKQGIPADQKEYLLALDYQNDARVGVSGLELQYENLLRGTDTKYTLSYDESGFPIPTVKEIGQNGSNLRISIDWELQAFADAEIEKILLSSKDLPGNENFNKLFFILMDPNNGDILVMAGKELKRDTDDVVDYAIGNYQETNLIGSTTKGGTIYAGFKEGVINENTTYLDTPWKIKGTPMKSSWNKYNLGVLNPVTALAQSSNIYMFNVAVGMAGGKYEPNQPLLGIDMNTFDMYRRDVGELGLGVKTGLDVTDEANANRGKNPQAGNLLDLVIGQYDAYTNIQLAQYTATLANGGKRVQPRLLLEAFVNDEEGNAITTYQNETTILEDVSDQKVGLDTVRKGYRTCVTNGLCSAPWASKGYTTYAKTGTAQVIDHGEYYNKLVVGWTETSDGHPEVAFSSIGVKNGQSAAQTGSAASALASSVLDKYHEKYGIK